MSVAERTWSAGILPASPEQGEGDLEVRHWIPEH